MQIFLSFPEYICLKGRTGLCFPTERLRSAGYGPPMLQKVKAIRERKE